MDYYVVLGITEDADESTVRSAFRSLARRFHPDVGVGSSPVEFQRVREAYETLVDPERRRQYDRQLRAARPQPVVVRDWRESSVTGRFVEPLVDSRPRRFVEPLAESPGASFGVPGTAWRGAWRAAAGDTVSRPALLDELIHRLVQALDDEWYRARRRW